MKKEELLKILKKTYKSFGNILPFFIAILLLISILRYFHIFTYFTSYVKNDFKGVILADLIGSISFGSSINAYLIANNFGPLNQYFLIITVFIISWITVGIIWIPLLSMFFGRKFALWFNFLAFIFSIILSYLIYFVYFL